MDRRLLATLLLLPLLAPLAAAEDAPSLGLAVDPPHQAVSAGETARFNLTVSNPGAAPLRVHVDARDDGWSPEEAPLPVTLDVQDATVAPGGSVVLALRVATTNATPAGFRMFRAEATSPDGAPANVTTFSLFVTPPPLAAPAPSFRGGGPATFEATLATPEVTLGGFGFTSIEVELRSESGFATVRSRLEDVDGAFGGALESQEPGRSLLFSPNVTSRVLFPLLPRNATPGDHVVRIHLWLEEDPNVTRTLDALVHVEAPQPLAPPLPIPLGASADDVEVRRPARPIEVAPGKETRVEYAFTNLGNASLTLSLDAPRVERNLSSPDAAPQGFRASWEGFGILDLAPGETLVRRLVVTAPADAKPGDRFVVLDGALPLSVGPGVSLQGQADLVITAPPLPPAPAASEPETPAVAAQPPAQEETADAQPAVAPEPDALGKMGDAVKAYPLAFGGIGVGLGALGLAQLLRKESWRYGFLAGLLPLYTRLSKPKLLDHAARDLLHRLICAEPGIHYSALQERTGLNTGALVHHLRTLERHRLVVSRREGALRRFYPVGAGPLPPVKVETTTPMQARVLALLDEGPLTQREIAERLGLTQQGANHHVKTLERKGLLAMEHEGGVTRCHRVHALSVER